MIVTHKIKLDLAKKELPPCIDAVQGDSCSRKLELTLLAGGRRAVLPEGTAVLVRYQKADGTGGAYDTLPDGRKAWEASENVLTVILAPQVCTAPGRVELTLTLLAGQEELSSFRIRLEVHPLPQGTEPSGDYVNTTCFIPQPESARVGEYLAVTGLSEDGRIATVESIQPPKSPYQLAREQGYSGTETEFNRKLSENPDKTLTRSGMPADAAAVGEALVDAGDAWEQKLAVERSRIDQLARLGAGSTTGDAELRDIRVGYEGTTYDSAGVAVRTQVGTVVGMVEALRERTSVLYTTQTLAEREKAVARRNIGAELLLESQGKQLTLDNSAAAPLNGLTVSGRSWQESTPSPDIPARIWSLGMGGSIRVKAAGKNLLAWPYQHSSYTTNGITFTLNEDGSVTANGTATGTAFFNINSASEVVYPAGTYYLSSGGSYTADNALCCIRASGAYVRATGTAPVPIVLSAAEGLRFMIRISSGQTLSNAVYYPMLSLSNDGVYEKSCGIAEAVLTSGLPLSGIPVTSGGNVTIGGQQYIADTLEVKPDGTGRVVKRTKRYSDLTYEKLAASYDVDGSSLFRGKVGALGTSNNRPGFCTHAVNDPAAARKQNVNAFYFDFENLYVRFQDVSDLEAFSDLAADCVFVVSCDPYEEALSQAEVAEVLALDTYKPVSNLWNDGDAQMTVQYAADLKTYIDQQLGLA